MTSPFAGPTAAFFDLDKTIIAKSSTLAFSKPFQAGGLISRRAVLRSAYAQFVYLVGGADHDQMEKMRAFMSQLCAGWDVATVREIVADTLHNIVDPLVFDEAVSLIEQHRLAGELSPEDIDRATDRFYAARSFCSMGKLLEALAMFETISLGRVKHRPPQRPLW